MLLLLSLIILQVFTIQNASLVVSNIPASNGIIHILSKVCWYMSHWKCICSKLVLATSEMEE